MSSQTGLRGRRRTHTAPSKTPATSAPDGSPSKIHSSSRKAKVRTILRLGYFGISGLLLLTMHQFGQIQRFFNQATTSSSTVRPRIYFVGGAKREARPIHDKHVFKFRRKRGDANDEDESSDDDDSSDGDESDKCYYKEKWQTSTFLTCNHLHQVDWCEGVNFITNGHYRDVFSFQEYDGLSMEWNVMVMKELRFEYDYEFDDRDRIESHRKDAVAIERLTASDNIPDIYASCINAAIVDYSPDGDLEQHVLKDGEHYKNYNSLEKLEFATQVASAIADVHEAGIAHTDIAPKQFLLLNGKYMLTDFNRCRLLKWNRYENRTCAFSVPKNPGKGRSPEEYEYKVLTRAIDVYSMGNVFYYMLMGFKYFDGVKTQKAQKRVMKGERPELSSEVLRSRDLAIQAIVRAMQLSQAQEPADRPTAREVSQYLLNVLNGIKAAQGRQKTVIS